MYEYMVKVVLSYVPSFDDLDFSSAVCGALESSRVHSGGTSIKLLEVMLVVYLQLSGQGGKRICTCICRIWSAENSIYRYRARRKSLLWAALRAYSALSAYVV